MMRKKILMTVIAGMLSLSSIAQTYLPLTAGIGNPLNGHLYLEPNSGSYRYIILNGTHALTGALALQAGGGSSGYGGGLVMFSHFHNTKPGWITAGISSGSNGKFSVNTYGNATGSDVFTVDVNGNGSFGDGGSGNRGIYLGTSGMQASLLYNADLGNLDITPREGYNTVFTNGNVGIGTTNPSAKLQINDTGFPQIRVQNDNHLSASGNAGIRFRTQGTEGVAHADIVWKGTGNDTGNMTFMVPYNAEVMRITSTGNIGIGTTSPAEKLSVNGKIRAKEIKVEATGWPDYVFEPSYSLPDLKQTEQFIKENKHLPEIPSAAEVSENGISLGEMNAKLLKKIEELTLYVIDLKKDNDLMKQEINQLKSKL